ncbi:MAG: polysaccharide biosynthesis C-terminal domain-containing protein [Candidatus Kerfeldbacteria bacterium]|nr:polysaccharide biosynthesis C-terminal domain-containing protein [Candidatus Kerfeldbacteria bacterium]
MSQARQLLQVIARLVTSRLLYRILVALSIIIASNYLITIPELSDIFDVASAAVSIIMIGSEVGMSMVLMRHGAEQNREKLRPYYGTALVIESLAWLGLFASIIGGYAVFNGFTTMFWLLAILGVNQAIIQYRVVIRSIYRSLRDNETITYIEIIDGACKLLGVWLITHWISNPITGAYWIALLYTITTIIFIGLYGWHSFSLVKPLIQWSLRSGMIKEGVWYSLQGLIMTVYFEIDKLIMRLFQSTGWADIAAGDIARYGAAARLIVFFLVFHRIGLQVITPDLYASFATNKDRYRRIVQCSTRYMGAFGIALGTGLIVLADDIMHLLYRAEFWSAIPALQLFGAFLIIRFIGITSSQVLATTGNQPLRTRQEGYAVVVNIVLDIILIPRYGFMGGAMATLATELLFQSIFFVMTRRLIQDSISRSLWQIVPALAAGLVMGMVIWFLKPLVLLWLLPLIGAAVFVLLLWLFRFFNEADFKLLKKTPTVI